MRDRSVERMLPARRGKNWSGQVDRVPDRCLQSYSQVHTLANEGGSARYPVTTKVERTGRWP